MNSLRIKMIVLVTGLAWNLGALAAPLSKAEYQAHQNRLSAEHRSALEACKSDAGNARDICLAEAEGQNRVALSGLEAEYKPSSRNRARARSARVEADYAVAIQRCDDLAANAKDVCVKEAKAARIAARADARAERKTSEAERIADEKSSAAHDKAQRQSNSAREDAAEDKRDADYAVAKEKCDAHSGAAKDACIDKAKLKFGKS